MNGRWGFSCNNSIGYCWMKNAVGGEAEKTSDCSYFVFALIE